MKVIAYVLLGLSLTFCLCGLGGFSLAGQSKTFYEQNEDAWWNQGHSRSTTAMKTVGGLLMGGSFLCAIGAGGLLVYRARRTNVGPPT